MLDQSDVTSKREGEPRYSWPWFVLAAVLLGLFLAVVWMSKEVERTRRLRELNSATPTIATNAPMKPPAVTNR
jgi:hypothetical protein